MLPLRSKTNRRFEDLSSPLTCAYTQPASIPTTFETIVSALASGGTVYSECCWGGPTGIVGLPPWQPNEIPTVTTTEAHPPENPRNTHYQRFVHRGALVKIGIRPTVRACDAPVGTPGRSTCFATTLGLEWQERMTQARRLLERLSPLLATPRLKLGHRCSLCYRAEVLVSGNGPPLSES